MDTLVQQHIASPRMDRGYLVHGAEMRLPPKYKKCVCFVGHYQTIGSKTTYKDEGTGFFVYVSLRGFKATYLVTARHVADQFHGSDVHLRLNFKGGESRLVPMPDLRWFPNLDPGVDIAVAPITPAAEWDHEPFNFKHVLDKDRIDSKGIQEGVPTYMPGQFWIMKASACVPIVHSGNIALIEGERGRRFEKGGGRYAIGHLIQTTALPGSSGSPVFLRRPLEVPSTTSGVNAEATGALFLLGVWIGTWFGDPDVLSPAAESSQSIKVPVSYGVVIPSMQLHELLESDPVKQPRIKAALEAEKKAKGGDAPDLEETSASGGVRQDLFDAALRAMLTTAPSPRPKSKRGPAKKK